MNPILSITMLQKYIYQLGVEIHDSSNLYLRDAAPPVAAVSEGNCQAHTIGWAL